MGELCIVLTEGVVGQDWTSQSFCTMHKAAAFQAVLCPESLCIPVFLVVYGTPKRNWCHFCKVGNSPFLVNPLILSEIALNQNKLSRYFYITVTTVEQDCVSLHCITKMISCFFISVGFSTQINNSFMFGLTGRVSFSENWQFSVHRAREFSKEVRPGDTHHQDLWSCFTLLTGRPTEAASGCKSYSWVACEDELKCSSKAEYFCLGKHWKSSCWLHWLSICWQGLLGPRFGLW